MKKRIGYIAIALGAAAVIASVAFANLNPGVKAPDFTLPTLDGKGFKLSSCFSKNNPKVVVLDIWATWCPPCRAEIPHLISIHKKFKNKGAIVVGVAIDAAKSDVVSFAKEQKINYTVLHDPQAETVGQPYRVRGIPATYIIDRNGTIRYAHGGFPRHPEEQKREATRIHNEIKTLLEEK